MAIQPIDQVDIQNKTVIVRVDFNVPMTEGKVADNTRILQSLPTIQWLRDQGAKVVLISHLGRPKGQRVAEMSLRPVAAALHKLLKKGSVYFSDETIGQRPASLIESLKPGEVALLENLRFNMGEELDDENFAAKLAGFADIYVNDAFSVSHRAHASVSAITRQLPSYAGMLLSKELKILDEKLNRPKHPVMAIVGGAKISSKIGLLKSLTHRVDTLAIVGGMANTFLYAQGFEVGKSLCEVERQGEAVQILAELARRGCKVILPTDVVVAPAPEPGVRSSITKVEVVPPDQMILDVGPLTSTQIMRAIDHARTLIWNGALGMTEIPPFEYATMTVARHTAARTKAGDIISVAGGGDTVAALNQASCFDDFSYVSMAGGAFLEWLQGYPLPGIEALREGGGD